MNTFSTYPFYTYFSDKNIVENTVKGEIVIGDDVWIGLDSLICSGAKVGKGCIVGSKSVVRGSFEPYSIIMGNPATCVKKRFPKEIIDILDSIYFTQLYSQIISKILELFYVPLDKHLSTQIANEIHSMKSNQLGGVK